MLTVSEATKRKLSEASDPVWLARIDLGPCASLTVIDYSLGSTETITLNITHSGGTLNIVYTEGTDFAAGASNATCSQAMADAINSDATVNNRVRAYVYADRLVVVAGSADDIIRGQNQTTIITIDSSEETAWRAEFDPIASSYYFSSALCAFDGAIPEIARIEGVSATLDPRTLQYAIGDAELTFVDANQGSVIRGLLKSCIVDGKSVRLWYGTKDMTDIADFVPAGSYEIGSSASSRGEIRLVGVEHSSALNGTEYFEKTLVPLYLDDTSPSASISSGSTFTITVRTYTAVTSVTWTEGVDFAGTFVAQRAALKALINGSALSPYICATVNEMVRIFPIGSNGESYIPYDERAVEIAIAGTGSLLTGELERSDYAFASTPLGGGWINMHPLTAIQRILTVSGVDTSRIDTTSLDKENWPTISHWGITACPYINEYTGSPDEENCFDIAQDLARHCQGALIPTEDGLFKFIRRDVTLPSVRTLTASDFDEVEWTELSGSGVTDVTVSTVAYGDTDDTKVLLMRASNDGAAILRAPIWERRKISENIESRWIGTYYTISNIYTSFIPPTDPVFLLLAGNTTVIDKAFLHGFSGCRTRETSTVAGAQATGDDINGTTRQAWIMVWQPESGLYEIMEVDSAVVYPAALGNKSQPLLGTWTPSDTYYRLDTDLAGIPLMYTEPFYFTLTRAQLDTSRAPFRLNTDTKAVDLTIAKAMIDHEMSFAYGTKEGEFQLTLDHGDLQVGDVVSVIDSNFIGLFQDGTSSADTFQIVSKEIQFPLVKFKVDRLASTVSTPVNVFRYYPTVSIMLTATEERDVVTLTGDVVTDSTGAFVIVE